MKPKEIIELERELGFELFQVTKLEYIIQGKDLGKVRIFLLNENNEVIGLNLADCEIKNIDCLTDFKYLKYLDLSENHISNISCLENLPNLVWLSLSENNISDISALKNLTNLFMLDLHRNLIDDSSLLFLKDKSLESLRQLNLGDNKISNLHPLQNLTNLTSLLLFLNFIKDITPLQKLNKLKELELRSNQIVDITPLQSLTNLEELSLANNKIPSISLNFLNSFPKLETLYLLGNSIIPKEIYDKSGNVLQDVRNYLTELEKDFIINETVKLIIVGNGRVGKTSMFKKLKGLPFDKNEKYTHGISIGTLEKENLPEAKTEKLKLNVWDFGGQEIFYATHQFFMRDDALYILAWTNEKNVLAYREKDADILPTNEPEKWHSCEYWLDTIRRYAKNSPILMVQTHCGEDGENAEEINTLQYTCEPHNVKKCFDFDAKFEHNLKSIKKAITKNLNSLNMYGEKFSKTYENVILQIENRKNENVISYSEFVNTICRNANISEGGENSLLSYLDKTGLVVHYAQHEKLQDKIYVNPEWPTKQVYSLINNKLKETEGKISLDYLKENLPNYEKFELIELFKKFELLFEVQDKNETFWISPQYLPENLEDNKSFQKQLDKSSVKLVFRFATFMPDNVMINFLSRYGSFAKDEYWKNGIYFTKYDSDCIVIRENSTDLYVYVDKNIDNTKLLQEICNAFVEFGKNAKTEISLDKENFVLYSEINDNVVKQAKEIKSLQGKILQMKDFWFLFAKQKNIKNMHFSQHIKKALTAIENASIAVYFDEMETVTSNNKVRSEDKTSFNKFQRRFINGDTNYEFSEQLEAFAKRLLKYLNQQEEIETTLQENIQKLPATTKQEIVESITTIKEVKGSENTSKAKAILGKIVEKLATSGITLAASWTAYFVLQNMGIDKATIDLFLEVYKNFSDSE